MVVEHTQIALNYLGKVLKVDNISGPITKAAIKSVDQDELAKIVHGIEHRVKTKIPLYVQFAFGELGTKEIVGRRHSWRVIQYSLASKWGRWVTTDEVPWCASFIGWCMILGGYIKEVPNYSLGAISWKKFGKAVSEPVFGAIAIKSRLGGNHVAFVIGKDGNYIYTLGGNQSNKVSIVKSHIGVWNYFRIPNDYTKTVALKKWTGNIADIGSEA